MASQKDKDYHKLRNSGKYAELNTGGDTYGEVNQESAEARARYRKIWSKYGFKSMVCDKRRRNTTRKSNQKDKQTMHQIQRAQFKSSFEKHLEDQDRAIVGQQHKGAYIIHVK